MTPEIEFKVLCEALNTENTSDNIVYE